MEVKWEVKPPARAPCAQKGEEQEGSESNRKELWDGGGTREHLVSGTREEREHRKVQPNAENNSRNSCWVFYKDLGERTASGPIAPANICCSWSF